MNSFRALARLAAVACMSLPLFAQTTILSNYGSLTTNPSVATFVGQPAYSQTFTAQTSVLLAHNTNTQNVIVQCYDNSNRMITPSGVTVTDVNDVTVTFMDAQTGRCVVNGSIGPSGSNATAFSLLTSGTNTGNTFTIGSGSSLSPSGGGSITANVFSGTLTASNLPTPAATTLGGVKSVTCASGISSINTDGSETCLAGSGATVPHSVGATFTAGGAALTSGVVTYVAVPFACTINGYSANADQGTFTVDAWKIASGTANPTVSNSIVGGTYPGLSSGTAVHSTTVSGWTTSVAANDIFGIQLRSVSGGVTNATFQVTCQ